MHLKLPARSAFVFGHNISWKHKWKNDGADDTLEDDTGPENNAASIGETPDLLSTSPSCSPQPSNRTTSSISDEISSLTTVPTSVSTKSGGQPVQQSPRPVHTDLGQSSIELATKASQGPPKDGSDNSLLQRSDSKGVFKLFKSRLSSYRR